MLVTIINLKRFKTEVFHFGFFIALSLLLFNCLGEPVQDPEFMVKQSIEAHGGIDNWENIKQLSFDKETTLFNEDGSVEIHTEQFQVFRMQPKLFGKIEWEDKGNDMLITFDNNKTSKTINDSLITSVDELNKAERSFFAAQYVVSQPFDLLNDDVELTYSGIVTLNGKDAHEVRVVYEGHAKDSDKWIYYLDVDTYEVIANKVVLKDHTSWVENLTFDTSTDFKFNAHRKSYRLNDAGEKTYLRAEYNYSNFMVIYDE